jgi:putative ABC transport system ATP-binding protein
MTSLTAPVPVVELLGARKVYRRGTTQVPGLDRVDMLVLRGEYVAVVGASGSGKSTLLNVVGTLDKLDEGSYRMDGQSTEELGDSDLSRLRCLKIGFVFQSFHLLGSHTALENVEVPMLYAGLARAERRKRALRALERVGLADRTDHLPSQLSGGQQQRVSLARALVNSPALLLADEPTGALDSTTTREILELLDELNHSGVTIVMVTHDREVAARTRRVVRMKDGCIACDAPAGAAGNRAQVA